MHQPSWCNTQIWLKILLNKKKKTLNTKCVSWFSLQLPSEIFLILGPNERGIIVNVHRFSRKVPAFLSGFNETWIFSTYFRKLIKFQISWKSVQWELSCFMRTDRRTAMMKLTVAFPNSAISCISAVDAFFPNTFCRTWYTSLKIQIHCYDVSHTRHCLDSSVKNHFFFVKYHRRSATTKQVSGWSLTADTGVQYQVNLRGICGAQSGIKTGLPPGNSILPT